VLDKIAQRMAAMPALTRAPVPAAITESVVSDA
jgi:hypothetical protein